MTIHPSPPITPIKLALIARELAPRRPDDPAAAVTITGDPRTGMEVTTIDLPHGDTLDLHLINRDLDWMAVGLIGPLGLGDIPPRRWVDSDDYWLVHPTCGDLERSRTNPLIEEIPHLGLDPVWDLPIDMAGDPTVVHLVDIEGASHTEVAWVDDGGPLRRVELRPARGLAHDACLRLLGLPTDPPGAKVLTAVATAWLDNVVGAYLAGPTGLDWSDAVALFPLRRFVEDNAQLDDLILAGWAIDEELSWQDWRDTTIPPDEAPNLSAWVDDGMFARLMLAHHPDLTDLVSLLEVLAGGLTTDIGAVLDAWGIVGDPAVGH